MYILLRSVPKTLYATSSSIGAYRAGLSSAETPQYTLTPFKANFQSAAAPQHASQRLKPGFDQPKRHIKPCQARLAVSEHLGRRITLSRRIAVKPTFDQLGPHTMHWLHAASGSTSYLPSYDSPVS